MRTLASHCRLSLPGASPSMPIGARTGPVSVSEPASIRAMRGAAPARAARLIPPICAVPPPATAFTMSIQTMPPGNRIPVHCHETEEVFFILDGECLVRCWNGEESFDLRLGRWDLVCLPPFLQHEVFNTGSGECQLQTLLAKPQPLRPQYADPELLKLQAAV